MSQPSVASYFNTRKRAAVEDLKGASVRKVLLLDKSDGLGGLTKTLPVPSGNEKHCDFEPVKCDSPTIISANNTSDCFKIVTLENCKTVTMTKRVAVKQKARTKPAKEVHNQLNIQDLLSNMTKKDTAKQSPVIIQENATVVVDPENAHRTPPSTPTKTANAMDKVNLTGNELSLKELKKTLSRSSRLAELKALIGRFKESQKKLDQIEKKTEKITASPSLKSFKTIELEVISPKKVISPEKPYLSPRKDSTVRKNLLNMLSPTKNAVALPSSPRKPQNETHVKHALTLPFKYRHLAEMFRSVDTVCQILFNRKETITFRKLKPAVEQMLKRNMYEKHLSQIKAVYPDAFKFRQEKLKVYGTCIGQKQWELIVEPNVSCESMTSDLLLTRRRRLFNNLIDKVKGYHNEFILTLDPPLHIPFHELKRWHPEFDIERVPDVECETLPQPPTEEKFTTGKDVLAKARTMFNCNTRMEQALERLKQARENDLEKKEEKPVQVESVLKGIPKALLEKVRQRQAAKALESMTRSAAKEKEVQLYSRLPEIARLTRNLFVAEKKSVLHIDVVVDKLSNSFQTYMTSNDLEDHLKTISKEVPGWLVIHEIRHSTFIKISKNADLSLVISKLEALGKAKTSA